MQGPTTAMVGLLATFVVCLAALVSYSKFSAKTSNPVALLSTPASRATRSRFSSLSLVSDNNLYREAFRNEMESEKNNLLTNYDTYRQQFRNEMESSRGMRAPTMVLADMVHQLSTVTNSSHLPHLSNPP